VPKFELYKHNDEFFSMYDSIYYERKTHHYAYKVQIWAHSGLKSSSLGHFKKFLFLVTAAILNGGLGCRTHF
jgi:hypothetical protein